MPEQNNSIAIFGDEDIIVGFSSLGFKTYAVKDQQEFKAALEEAMQQKSAICLIQENIYNLVKEEIDTYRSSPLPIFIPFSKSGKTALLDEIARDIRLRATGTFQESR